MDDLTHWHGGPLLVLGAAGTGKTTMVATAAAARLKLRLAPALVLTGSRQAASELRDRVALAAGRATVQPPIMTIHALALSLLERFGDSDDVPQRLLTAPEQEFRIRELLAGWGRDRWPAELSAAAATSGFARQVRGAIARARQLGLDPADLATLGQEAGDPAWESLGNFMEEYLAVLDLEGVIDYAELIHRVRILVSDNAVAEVVRGQYDSVWVDELAELDPAQLALVRALAPTDGTVVGLADPDTSIYRFRGADPRAVSEFRRLFAPIGGDVPTVVLEQSYRLGAEVTAALAGVARRLGAPALGAGEVARYRSSRPAAVPGRLDAWTFASETDQAARIAGELRAAHVEEGITWGEMAVMVRSGRRQLPALARALVDAGIPVEVAGDEIGLAEELAVRPLLLALEIAARGVVCDADEAMRLLTSGWGGLDSVALRSLGRALRVGTPGLAGADAVAAVLTGVEVAEVNERAAGALSVVVGRARLLAQASSMLADGRRPEEVLWLLWNGAPWPGELRAAALRGGDASRRANRDLDAVLALFSLASESQAAGGVAGVRAFLAEVAQQQIPADVQRESAVTGRGVRLLTAHRAKGREWDFVVVAGVQEGIWPDVRRYGSIFDPERLRADALGEGVEIKDLVASERRLFLLACTRARRRLIVAAVAGTEGQADQPSRFISELGIGVGHPPAPGETLHTLRDLVASLRAASVDPEASSPLREAAALRLARLAVAVDADGRQLVRDADPDRWWGTRVSSGAASRPTRGVFEVSPSQLSLLLSCPRRYFLEREARAEPPRGSGAVLGSVIHLLAEHAVRDSLSLDEAVLRLDDVWGEIPFAAAWLSDSERVEASNAVARLIAWQDAHKGIEVVGAEVPFQLDVTVDGHELRVRGSVDRLERLEDGSLRVVDFKSSRRALSKAEVAAHEQLGLYQLAVESGAFEAMAPGSSRSAGGELVFLREGDQLPKVLGQPPLSSTPHLGEDPEEERYPTWVHHRIGVACATLAGERWDASPGGHCQRCPFATSCPTASGQVVT